MAEKDKKDSKKDKPMTREEALENALKQIEKAHGKGAIMRLGEAKANMNIEVILHSALAASRAGASSRYMVPSPPARRP